MSENENKGITGLEKSVDLTVKGILLGIAIAEDGLNLEDVKHLPKVAELSKEIYDFVASKPELVAEVKDIDSLELMAILKKAYDAYKSVKEVA